MVALLYVLAILFAFYAVLIEAMAVANRDLTRAEKTQGHQIGLLAMMVCALFVIAARLSL